MHASALPFCTLFSAFCGSGMSEKVTDLYQYPPYLPLKCLFCLLSFR